MPKKKATYGNAQARRRRMLIRRIISVTIISLFVLAAATVCFLLLSPSFDINRVTCEGNDNISETALLDTAAVPVGGNIFLTPLGDAKKRVENMEYVTDVKLERRLPTTICIVVTEKQPSAYFSVGQQLALTNSDGRVLEVISSPTAAEEIVSSKVIKEEEPEPSASPEKEEEESAEDDKIWGYDDDGDPIYKVNGGHYEFDEDGNRFFVDDSAASPSPDAEPSASPLAAEYADVKFDELPRTSDGTLIYNAPVVSGVNISSFKQGDKIKSGEEDKLSAALDIISSLENASMLSRATQIDVENLSDIKVYIESRLEIMFGNTDNIDYKVKFVSTVINENISKYEHAVLDFRGSKLYVRSSDSAPVRRTSPSPSPSSDADEDTDTQEDTEENTSEDTEEAAAEAEAEDEEATE